MLWRFSLSDHRSTVESFKGDLFPLGIALGSVCPRGDDVDVGVLS